MSFWPRGYICPKKTQCVRPVETCVSFNLYRYEGSLCDLILDYRGYSGLLDHYNSLPFHRDKHVPDYNRSVGLPSTASSLEQLTSSPSPVPSTSRTSPIPGPSSTPDQEQSTSMLHISPFFHNFNFYPERRPGKGPKKLNTVLDRVYAISSTTKMVVEEFKRQRQIERRKKRRKSDVINRKNNLRSRKNSLKNKNLWRLKETNKPPKKSCPP